MHNGVTAAQPRNRRTSRQIPGDTPACSSRAHRDWAARRSLHPVNCRRCSWRRPL